MDSIRTMVRSLVNGISPYDDLEQEHIEDTLTWIDSGKPMFRVSKPDNPPKHLVSYFLLYDKKNQALLLIDHIKARLWLPAGGHVEINENPKDAVIREAEEELNIKVDFETSFGDKPFFITVTRTQHAYVHTDVSLWYVIKGSIDTRLRFDRKEMNNYKWFNIEEVLSMNSSEVDPHMHRFINKFKLYLERLDKASVAAKT